MTDVSGRCISDFIYASSRGSIPTALYEVDVKPVVVWVIIIY